jgi:hypothetical protein
MTISVLYSTRSSAFVATAGQTAFPLDWPVLAAGDVVVTRYRLGEPATLVLGADYAVTGAGQQTGAQIVLTTGSADKDVLLIEGRMTPQSLTAFMSNRNIPADGFNTALAAMTIMIQELRRDVDRAGRPYILPEVVSGLSQ